MGEISQTSDSTTNVNDFQNRTKLGSAVGINTGLEWSNPTDVVADLGGSECQVLVDGTVRNTHLDAAGTLKVGKAVELANNLAVYDTSFSEFPVLENGDDVAVTMAAAHVCVDGSITTPGNLNVGQDLNVAGKVQGRKFKAATVSNVKDAYTSRKLAAVSSGLQATIDNSVQIYQEAQRKPVSKNFAPAIGKHAARITALEARPTAGKQPVFATKNYAADIAKARASGSTQQQQHAVIKSCKDPAPAIAKVHNEAIAAARQIKPAASANPATKIAAARGATTTAARRIKPAASKNFSAAIVAAKAAGLKRKPVGLPDDGRKIQKVSNLAIAARRAVQPDLAIVTKPQFKNLNVTGQANAATLSVSGAAAAGATTLASLSVAGTTTAAAVNASGDVSLTGSNMVCVNSTGVGTGAGRCLSLINGATSYAVYVARGGLANGSAGNGTAAAYNDVSEYALRFRTSANSVRGFIFENTSDQALASLNATTGNLYVRGNIVAGGSVSGYGGAGSNNVECVTINQDLGPAAFTTNPMRILTSATFTAQTVLTTVQLSGWARVVTGSGFDSYQMRPYLWGASAVLTSNTSWASQANRPQNDDPGYSPNYCMTGTFTSVVGRSYTVGIEMDVNTLDLFRIQVTGCIVFHRG